MKKGTKEQMDNNNTPIAGGTPNPNQPVVQPTPQPAAQPIPDQPIAQPISGAPNEPKNSKKKMGIIIGCSIGAVAVIATAVILLIMFLGHGGEKTVSCTLTNEIMDIAVTGETNVKIKDGEISGGDMTINVDLKSLSDFYKDYESDLVDGITEGYKEHCSEHCTFDYNYIEGDSVKYTMQYDKEGVSEIVKSSETEGASAQEIADEVQKTLEEEANATCTQH